MHDKATIGTINFSKITRKVLEGSLIEIIKKERRCFQIVVANVYSIYLASKDRVFNSIAQSSEIVIADGLPVVWASNILGKGIPERIAGPDFMWEFLSTCAKEGFSVFFLGGRQDCLDGLVQNVKKTFNNIKISGAYSPPFGEWGVEENKKILNLINTGHTDVLWLGVSTPKQDRWIFDHKAVLKAKVAIGVGAAFDFHSGRVKRAPGWVQNMGLEWMHRFIQEPRRMWKRYLTSNIMFIKFICKEILKKYISITNR